MHRIFDCAMLWEYLPPDRNPMSLVRIEGSSKRRTKPRILTPEEFTILIASVDREPCHTTVILALCTGVRCSELVALRWSDFDWQNLSVYIRRAIVSGRVDDVKTEYSEAPLPLDPALRTDRLAYASPHLQGVARRQWRAAYGAEGTHAARIHSDHPEYVWRRDDGLNAGSAFHDARLAASMYVHGVGQLLTIKCPRLPSFRVPPHSASVRFGELSLFSHDHSGKVALARNEVADWYYEPVH
jgi:integrase